MSCVFYRMFELTRILLDHTIFWYIKIFKKIPRQLSKNCNFRHRSNEKNKLKVKYGAEAFVLNVSSKLKFIQAVAFVLNESSKIKFINAEAFVLNVSSKLKFIKAEVFRLKWKFKAHTSWSFYFKWKFQNQIHLNTKIAIWWRYFWNLSLGIP